MKFDLQLREDELPPTVRNLIRLAGWRGALALVRELPGARIYCPANGPDEHDARFAFVAELTSWNAARRIYKEYCGSVLEIPNCRAAMRAARNRWIRSAYDAGTSIEELCLRTGTSRRQIFDILKGTDPSSPDCETYDMRSGQMGLF